VKLISIIREPEFGYVALRLAGVDWSAVMNARDDLDLRHYDVPPVDRSALDRLREQLDEATRELEAASAKVAAASADVESAIRSGASPSAVEARFEEAEAKAASLKRRIPILEKLVAEAHKDFKRREAEADLSAKAAHKAAIAERLEAASSALTEAVKGHIPEAFALIDAVRFHDQR
jgi:hypothetical protein